MKISKSSTFRLAWTLFKSGIFQNFGDALKTAWRQAIQGENHVTFKKKSTGEETTRRISLVSLFYQGKGNELKGRQKDTLKFADLDKIEAGVKNFIISFHPEQVISFC